MDGQQGDVTDDGLFEEFFQPVRVRSDNELNLDVRKAEAPYTIKWGPNGECFGFDPAAARHEGLDLWVDRAIARIRSACKGPISTWVESMPPRALEFHRYATDMLQRLHADVWNVIGFLLAVNTVLFGGMIVIFGWSENAQCAPILLIVLAVGGYAVTCVALRILGRHRDHYLKMLLRTTLIEEELGFAWP